MAWLIVYLVGIPIMFQFLAKRLGEDKLYDHSMAQGRIVMSFLWPIFAPILLMMWIKIEKEESEERARREEWYRKARGEGV